MLGDIATSIAKLDHIALIGNSVPRRCGIATFTTHCFDALRARYPDLKVDLYAMDDGRDSLNYADDIQLIAQHDRLSYSVAARQIEESGAQAIWLQHEFGIFGGPAGEYALQLLARTRIPVITTLHTVLERPTPEERRVMEAIVQRSSMLIVMAECGWDILRRVYGVEDGRIAVIPHGVPDRPLVAPDSMKDRFGWANRKVVLTFGLLAPDKGIDNMIQAMPAIVAKEPSVLYVVLGATHPNVVREHGEQLRQSLAEQAAALGVGDHVQFIDSYVEQEELLDYLQAADIYVTPYVNPAQITSGTLSYAVAMGKPVVSTGYIHAAELLADNHGIIVPFRDSNALAEAVGSLLSDDNQRDLISRRAYQLGRTMLWSKLAERTHSLITKALAHKPARFVAKQSYAAVRPDAQAVLRMSDGTGMLQHAVHSVPDRSHGYCIDDNARALMLMARMPELEDSIRDQWMTIYAGFVQYAWNEDRGRFRNFMNYDRSWCEDVGSEDSNGRTLWAIAVTARDAPFAKHRNWAMELYHRVFPRLTGLEAARSRAFAMLGAAAMLDTGIDHIESRQLIERSGEWLLARYHATRSEGWDWFETVLAYDNMRLPEAMIRGGHLIGRGDFVDCGLATLDWLTERHLAPEGYFRAVGTESFGREHSAPLPFDQQPLEAQAAIEAAEAAYEVQPVQHWLDLADKAYSWYLGRNDLDTPLASRGDGGCYDGLTPFGVNRNQGAESLLALQLSSCAIIRLSNLAQKVADKPTQPRTA